MWLSFSSASLQIVSAILLFIFGWFFAKLLKSAIIELFDKVQIDKALQKAGVDDALHQAGFKLRIGSFIGSILKWFVVLLFLKLSMNVMSITALDEFFGQIIGYVPDLFIGIVILMATSILSRFAKILVEGSSKGLEVRDSKILGNISYIAVWIFGISAAASNLGINAGLISWFLIGIIAMVSLAGGLAFGIGGQDFAKRMLERFERNNIK